MLTTTTTPRGDHVAELAMANMSGLIDGATRRPLPHGLDRLATDEWIDVYRAGFLAGAPVTLHCANPAHAHHLAHSLDCLAPLATIRCSCCGDPALRSPCGPCRREAAGL